MVSLSWCLNQSKGIKFIEPNENLSKEYLKDKIKSLNLSKINKIREELKECYK